MSPSDKYIDITTSLADAIDNNKILDPIIKSLVDRWDTSEEEIVIFILLDGWCLEKFKESWVNPQRKLTKVDAILIENCLEEESKLRRS